MPQTRSRTRRPKRGGGEGKTLNRRKPRVSKRSTRNRRQTLQQKHTTHPNIKTPGGQPLQEIKGYRALVHLPPEKDDSLTSEQVDNYLKYCLKCKSRWQHLNELYGKQLIGASVTEKVLSQVTTQLGPTADFDAQNWSNTVVVPEIVVVKYGQYSQSPIYAQVTSILNNNLNLNLANSDTLNIPKSGWSSVYKIDPSIIEQVGKAKAREEAEAKAREEAEAKAQEEAETKAREEAEAKERREEIEAEAWKEGEATAYQKTGRFGKFKFWKKLQKGYKQ